MKYGLFYEGNLLSYDHSYDNIRSAIKAANQIVYWKRRIQGYVLARISIKQIQ